MYILYICFTDFSKEKSPDFQEIPDFLSSLRQIARKKRRFPEKHRFESGFYACTA